MIDVVRNGHILELYIQTNDTNSMGLEFFRALGANIEEAEVDRDIKAVMLSSRNEKFFSNGFDPSIFIGRSREDVYSVLQSALDASGKVLFSKKPVVCAMNGHAMGVGAVLAIFSDYRILVEKKGRIGFPESLIGINFPSTSAYVLTQLVGIRTARDLLYSGRALKSDEALSLGLVDESASPEEVLPRARAWCAQFENMAPESVIGVKVALRDSQRVIAAELASNDLEFLAEAVMSPNGQEGMRSILEKRRPKFS